MIAAVVEFGPRCGVRALCTSLGLAPATYYRTRPQTRQPVIALPRASPARALRAHERADVLAVLHDERFIDCASAQVYATLLDEGMYLCAERTMYRVLAAHAEVRERRAQRRHPHYTASELLATRPNQLWSWDITKLKGPTTWSGDHLYVILDVFSRHVVGWMLAPRESAAHAEQLITTCCAREQIGREQLTIQADRGAAMTSKAVAFLLADLGITQTHSRPHVSNDNPYSEAQFKTLKYRPDFPARFGSIEDARVHGAAFFIWYNTVHRHSSLGLHTPHDVHYGLAAIRRMQRATVLTAAYRAHPNASSNTPRSQRHCQRLLGSIHPNSHRPRKSFNKLHTRVSQTR